MGVFHCGFTIIFILVSGRHVCLPAEQRPSVMGRILVWHWHWETINSINT